MLLCLSLLLFVKHAVDIHGVGVRDMRNLLVYKMASYTRRWPKFPAARPHKEGLFIAKGGARRKNALDFAISLWQLFPVRHMHVGSITVSLETAI